MPRSHSFGAPINADQEKIQQQLRYAAALQQQSLQPNQGRMVSGHYVGPSWTQGLAKLGQAWAGGSMTANALKSSKAIESREKAELIETLKQAQAGNMGALITNPATAHAGIQAVTAQQRAEAQAKIQASQFSEDRRWREEQSVREQAARAQEAEAARGFTGEQAAAARGFAGEQNALNRQSRMQTGAGAQPFYQFLPGENGYLVGNARTGQLTPGMVGGEPVMPGALSPSLQEDLSKAKAGGKVAGESAATSKIELPNTLADADQTLKLIDQITEHPGLPDAVGVKGASMLFGALDKPFAGTDAAGFMALKEQLGGKQFLEAFKSLMGGGHITEVEGEKATNALARMQTSQSEAEFKAAAAEFKSIVQAAKQRAIKKADGAWDGNERRQLSTEGWTITPAP